MTIADVLALSVAEARRTFAEDEPIARLAGAMDDLGLGYLKLGQRSASLSRGEGQRVKLATILGKVTSEPTMLLLDEPDRGLHPTDIARLLRAFDALVEQGHTIVAISHHRHVWAAADYVTLVEDGVARDVELDALQPLSRRREPRATPSTCAELHLQGVRVHNLRDVDVRIPHDALTVVAGVSGSGKSSLVFHTLASEAWHRYAESLPFAARRFVRRLPRPKVAQIEGLRPAVVLRQGQAIAPIRSTVATQSELGPLLRTLWSRAGRLDGQPCHLTAEHFSPDRPLGACPACEGRGVVARCDPDRLVTHPELPLMGGALKGTKPGKFLTEPDGQYMATLRAAAGNADLDRPWRDLPDDLRALILEGDPNRTLDVTWNFKRGARTGQHHFEGTWDGLCALVETEARRRANSKQAEAWAAPLRDSECPSCHGKRLRSEVASVRVGPWTLPGLLRRPVTEVLAALSELELDGSDAAVLEALRPELSHRLEELRSLGLGHLSLDRRSPTLSEGERQRVRLAGVLHSGLTSTLVILDEPAAGLHPQQTEAVLQRVRHLRDLGNTVVVVSHRPELFAGADHVIELGPAAGEEGGQIVAEGTPQQVLAGDSPTAIAAKNPPRRRRERGGEPPGWIEIEGAHVHNLDDLDVRLPAAGFVAVTGVSGSGKSSLIFDVLQASAETGNPIGCRTIRGLPSFTNVASHRRAPSNTTPLGALGLMPALQKHFAAAGKEHGLPKQAFSFASPAGRCEVCKGTGRQEVSMDVLADLSLPCPSCDGRRYRPEVLDVRVDGLDVAEVLALPAASLRARVSGQLARGLDDLVRVGLGHIALGRRRGELSGGETQRLGLAVALRAKASPSLLLLDEPATGLHEQDLSHLVDVFDEMTSRGDLIVAAEHRMSLVRAADWVIDLGPGGGPDGGRLVAMGPPEELREGSTARYLAV
jgi:excinuclease ABC subunit A